jgi:hypothetical protein
MRILYSIVNDYYGLIGNAGYLKYLAICLEIVQMP